VLGSRFETAPSGLAGKRSLPRGQTEKWQEIRDVIYEDIFN